MEIIPKPITTKDLEDLLIRARASKQHELESILYTVLACMNSNELLGLQKCTREYSLAKIKEKYS